MPLFLFTDKENCINNQELPKLMIVSFILLTLAFDSRLILLGENRYHSLLEVKG